MPQEESKEKYIARIRREQGLTTDADLPEETAKPKSTLKERLGSIFFMLLVLLFIWMLYSVFGMFKAN